MTRLTRTGWVLLAVCIVMYGASMTSQSGLLLFPIGTLLGCFVVNWFAARRAVLQLEIEPPPSVHIAEGQTLSQPWRIENTGDSAAGFIRVESPAGPLLRLGGMGPAETAHLVPRLEFQRRGVFRNEEAAIFSFYPFGLLRYGRRRELPGEVVVHPAIYETASPRAAGYDAMVGGRFKGGRRSNSGSQFSGVRQAQPGDPLKNIHWKSSSKGRGLMTKSFDEELSGRVAFVMDCKAGADPAVFDNCARAAGSLMFSALDEGHHVEWIDLASMRRLIVPPFADGHEILDTLARLETREGCLRADRIRKAAEAVSRKAALAFVLLSWNDDTAEAIAEIAARGRRVSVYLPEDGMASAGPAGLPMSAYGKDRISPVH